MRPEFYILYGIPTLSLIVGLGMYAMVRLQKRRRDRRAVRADGAKMGPI
jgi:hypothetical protein